MKRFVIQGAEPGFPDRIFEKKIGTRQGFRGLLWLWHHTKNICSYAELYFPTPSDEQKQKKGYLLLV